MADRTDLLPVCATPGPRGRGAGGGDLDWDGWIVRPTRGSDGVKVGAQSRLTTFGDEYGGGLKHRMAGAGAGVMFFGADNDGALSQKREHVFTEWGERRKRNGPVDRFRRRTRGARVCTANSDLEALRSYFDTGGDGKLTAADADVPQYIKLSLKRNHQPPQSGKRNMHIAVSGNSAPFEFLYCELGFCYCAAV